MADRSVPPVPDARTRADQARAADPGQSAWVSANAGSGKTWVLSTRVIRILLAGTDPSRILCLTYTRAAAAEMKSRVFDRLGAWATMTDDALKAEIEAVDGTHPDGARLAFARTLFARALETPGGLKIQTIHAFCEALLHRFPLEANIAGHFELLDDQSQALLVAQARRGLLIETRQVSGAGEAVVRLLPITGEAGMEKLLDEIVSKRLAITSLLRRLGAPADRRAIYREAFGFSEDDSTETLAASAWPLDGFSQADLAHLEAAASLNKPPRKTHLKLIGALRDAAATTDPGDRLEALARAFLKKDGDPATNNLFPADILRAVPGFEDNYLAAAHTVQRVRDRLHLLAEVDNTLDVLAVADGLIARYERLKRARGLLDFDDLIASTRNMLLRQDAAIWVRYKLDQGIDHILIDEAQDTAPAQWDVIGTLAGEFFTGHSAREQQRTIFAVGDEKQSIFSFQGADPDRFADTRDAFAGASAEADMPFAPVRLQASFRATQAVLDAVDHVFADETNRAGLSRDDQVVRHRALRQGAQGRVEVWEMIAKTTAEDPEDWTAPVDATTEPAIAVAERIADTISRWLADGTLIEATGRPVAPSDILVLVRSRDGFVAALSRALKDRGVPVAGADRLKMSEHIAVLDLIALGRVMLNTADDLSLAALIKSPLVGLGEQTVFDLAHARGARTLWERMQAHDGDPAVRDAWRQLSRWRSLARTSPVHEFYAHVLSAGGGRARLVGRLGPETADVLDEFIALTLAAERTGPPALETFLATLETRAPEIKREMDPSRGEVRIMTVHGAKGLEAPVVFLVDRGATPFNANQAPGLLPVDLPSADDAGVDGLLWRGTPGIRSRMHADAMADLERAAREEYRRLLYVGMTRAADWLIVAGYHGVRTPSEPTWHQMITDALSPVGEAIDTPDGPILRFPAGLDPVAAAKPADGDRAAASAPLPPGFAAPAPAEPPAARPLVPSGAAGLAVARETADAEADVPMSLLDATATDPHGNTAMRRGTVLHTLLQMLPVVPAEHRADRARRFCKRASLDDASIDGLLMQVFAVLEDRHFAPLFGPRSLAEVPVMGTIRLGDADRAVSGVIDRLAVSGDDVLLIDYKTGRAIPQGAGAVAPAHLRQMALYRALVAPLYPAKTVRALLLFTAGPQIIELPGAMLDAALAELARA